MKERKNVKFPKEILLTYREHLQDRKQSVVTIEKYLQDVKVFMEYLNERGRGEGEVDSRCIADSNETLDEEVIREYKQYPKNRYKITSANSVLVALNNFLVSWGKAELKVKLFKMQRTQYSKPEREMTEKDCERSILAAREKGDMKMSMLIQTIGSTGVRIGELEFTAVESLRDGRAEIYNKGKCRVVLLPVELTKVLRKYYRKTGIVSDSIFVTKHGDPIGGSNVSKKMKQLGRETGVDMTKVFPHNLRRLFARIFYSIEKDVVRLMDLLGHSSIDTTRIYTMTTGEQPRRQMSRMRMVLG